MTSPTPYCTSGWPTDPRRDIAAVGILGVRVALRLIDWAKATETGLRRPLDGVLLRRRLRGGG